MTGIPVHLFLHLHILPESKYGNMVFDVLKHMLLIFVEQRVGSWPQKTSWLFPVTNHSPLPYSDPEHNFG